MQAAPAAAGSCLSGMASGAIRLVASSAGWELPGESRCLFWQVNHSPSFTTDTHLDQEVKDALLCDTINLINVHACNKRKVLEEDKQRAKERLLQAHQTLRAFRYCSSPSCGRAPATRDRAWWSRAKLTLPPD